MKRAALLLSAILWTSGLSAGQLSVKVRNVSNNAVVTQADFGGTSAHHLYNSCQQYLDIGYPSDGVQRTLRIYSNNKDYSGAGGDHSGLISTDTVKRVPMVWIDTFAVVPGGIAFSSVTESSFTPIVDINDADFDAKKDSAVVSMSTGGATYVYLGAKLSTGAVNGNYKAKLVIELASSVSDSGAPKITHTPHPRIFSSSGRPLIFTCIVNEDVQIATAALHYRMNGEVAYSSAPLTFTQNPRNPFQWFAESQIPAGAVKIGPMSYYFEASDGFSDGFAGSTTTPYVTEILAEYSAVEDPMPRGGGQIVMFDGDARFGSTELDMPTGCGNGDVTMTSRKVNPQSLPTLRGNTPFLVYEFHPDRPCDFVQRAQIALKYEDSDGDGLVDGTNIQVKNLKLFWWDNFEWRYIGGAADPNTHVVRAGLTHLSTFGLFDGSGFNVDYKPREKIITPATQDGKNDVAVFDGLDGQPFYFTIKIFDMQGRCVRTLTQFGRWDGRDDQGNIVEGGVYLYQVHVNEAFGGRTVSGLITVAK